MEHITGWTGAGACALQSALRLSNESFAEHLGIGARTVASWHQKPGIRPRPEIQQLLDTALERASEGVRTRFVQLVAEPENAPVEPSSDAERRLSTDPDIGAALDWLDRNAQWEPGTARRAVALRLDDIDERELQDRGHRRGRVSQQDLARALADYYGDSQAPYGLYSARIGPESLAQTSVVTRPEWLDLNCPLNAAHDRLRVKAARPDSSEPLSDTATDAAVQRLAETLSMGVRMTDSPLYRLLGTDVHERHLGGSVGVAQFVEYALTMDLLEGELVDAIASGCAQRPGALPLRDHYLPDLPSVLALSERLCAGGALALCAIARPADQFRGPADYVLLVQERSGHVLNSARRLAVIPKGFHQPLIDLRADVQIGATLRREMEEELFGRTDVDGTAGDQRSADPMHPSRLSEPMRWLLAEPGRLRIECTGFGLNLVSGNYEFACLIVIEDEQFWAHHGGAIEANWESSALRRYSSHDEELVTELLEDVAWSNEGLFAMTEGLRRLAEIGGDRVALPPIAWEVR